MTDREKLIEAMARAMCREGGFDPDERMANDGPRWRYYVPNVNAALAAIEAEGAVVVPVPVDDTMLNAGVYSLADHLCASEYVNGPDASVVLALAHLSFVSALDAALAASPYRRPEDGQ